MWGEVTWSGKTPPTHYLLLTPDYSLRTPYYSLLATYYLRREEISPRATVAPQLRTLRCTARPRGGRMRHAPG